MGKLFIKPGQVFICGPISGDLKETELKFHKSEAVLNSYGLNAINEFMLHSPAGITLANLKFTIMHLANCNTIVTLQNWASCDYAKKQVEIARILDIDVIDYAKLVLELTEKHA